MGGVKETLFHMLGVCITTQPSGNLIPLWAVDGLPHLELRVPAIIKVDGPKHMLVSKRSKQRLLYPYVGLDTQTHLVRILHGLKFGKALLLVEQTCGVHTQHNFSAPITCLRVKRLYLRHGWHLCWPMLSQLQIRRFDQFQSKSGHKTTFKR